MIKKVTAVAKSLFPASVGDRNQSSTKRVPFMPKPSLALTLCRAASWQFHDNNSLEPLTCENVAVSLRDKIVTRYKIKYAWLALLSTLSLLK
jgi:hypothetical protein